MLGFRVLVFRVWGLECRVWGLGFGGELGVLASETDSKHVALVTIVSPTFIIN